MQINIAQLCMPECDVCDRIHLGTKLNVTTDIPSLSSAHLVSNIDHPSPTSINIRYQHRCNLFSPLKLQTCPVKVKVYPKTTEFSEIKMKKRELEANITSIRLELSENEHLKLEAETKRDDLAKVGFRNDSIVFGL